MFEGSIFQSSITKNDDDTMTENTPTPYFHKLNPLYAQIDQIFNNENKNYEELRNCFQNVIDIIKFGVFDINNEFNDHHILQIIFQFILTSDENILREALEFLSTLIDKLPKYFIELLNDEILQQIVNLMQVPDPAICTISLTIANHIVSDSKYSYSRMMRFINIDLNIALLKDENVPSTVKTESAKLISSISTYPTSKENFSKLVSEVVQSLLLNNEDKDVVFYLLYSLSNLDLLDNSAFDIAMKSGFFDLDINHCMFRDECLSFYLKYYCQGFSENYSKIDFKELTKIFELDYPLSHANLLHLLYCVSIESDEYRVELIKLGVLDHAFKMLFSKPSYIKTAVKLIQSLLSVCGNEQIKLLIRDDFVTNLVQIAVDSEDQHLEHYVVSLLIQLSSCELTLGEHLVRDICQNYDVINEIKGKHDDPIDELFSSVEYFEKLLQSY